MSQAGGSETDYVNVVKTVKKDNVTPQNISEIMLCQIPGVGAAAGIAIIRHFKSIVNLIADLQEQGENCLKNIEVTAASGKTKKLLSKFFYFSCRHEYFFLVISSNS